jgi:hypothetical protein
MGGTDAHGFVAFRIVVADSANNGRELFDVGDLEH